MQQSFFPPSASFAYAEDVQGGSYPVQYAHYPGAYPTMQQLQFVEPPAPHPVPMYALPAQPQKPTSGIQNGATGRRASLPEHVKEAHKVVAAASSAGSGVHFHWGLKRSITGFIEDEYKLLTLDMKAAMAEFLAMTLFVISGCGIACANGASDGETRSVVAFGFGMSIMVLAFAIGHHSGGHINCAVTLSLVLANQVAWYQGVLNVFFQILGSLFGALILAGIFDCDSDMTTNLGSNVIAPGYTDGQTILGEVVMTFLLCMTVFETAVNLDSNCGRNSCIAIGFSVFIAHLLLLPIDGCSINPTRSFGPAIVSEVRGCNGFVSGIDDLWVMVVGPLAGAVLAAIVQYPFIRILERDARKKE